MNSYISIDCETTGLSAILDRIVELGAVRFDETGHEIDRYQSLVNPGCTIPEKVIKIHGITNEEVQSERSIDKVLPEFLNFITDGSTLVAHYATFDVDFINQEIIRSCLDPEERIVLDTWYLAKYKYPSLKTYNLKFLVEHFRIKNEGYHRAIKDCMNVKELWLKLGGPRESHANIRQYKIRKPRLGNIDGVEKLKGGFLSL